MWQQLRDNYFSFLFFFSRAFGSMLSTDRYNSLLSTTTPPNGRDCMFLLILSIQRPRTRPLPRPLPRPHLSGKF